MKHYTGQTAVRTGNGLTTVRDWDQVGPTTAVDQWIVSLTSALSTIDALTMQRDSPLSLAVVPTSSFISNGLTAWSWRLLCTLTK